MRNSRIRAAAIVFLTAAAVAVSAPAGAAPNGPGDAEKTIKNLQSQGYTVIVNRLGTTPLDQASVVAVRPGPNYSRADTLSAVTRRTVYVDVK